jgi:hypothetical protein
VVNGGGKRGSIVATAEMCEGVGGRGHGADRVSLNLRWSKLVRRRLALLEDG